MKTVATLYNENGSCELVLEIKNVDNLTYEKLVRDSIKNKQEKEQRLLDLESEISTLNDKVGKLEHEIKVLKGEEDNEESI